MKRTIPLVIASVAGLVMVLANFVPAAKSWEEATLTWFNILAAAALVLGGGNLLRVQLQEISDGKPGWGYALVTAVSFIVTMLVGLFKVGVQPEVNSPDFPWSGDYLQTGSALWWLFEYILSPVTAALFSMLAFFVASAAYRAFRAKNLEATLLLITAVIMLLGRTYAGVWLTGWLPKQWSWLRIDRFSEEILFDVIAKSGFRAITIGIALGVVATSLKILLGLDRSYLGSEE